MLYIKEHYFLIVVSGICLATAVVSALAKRETASINLQIYLSHFSNNEAMNDRINAGAIWTFILLLCPIVIKGGRNLAKYTVSMLVGLHCFDLFYLSFPGRSVAALRIL